jgi:transcription factor SPT20
MQQYSNGIVPEEADKNLRGRCQQLAHQQVTAGFRARRQQMMAAQGGMQQMNGMQNGIGM